MKTKILICLGALLAVAAVVNRIELPLGKVTVRVIDEKQRPVPDATVLFVFQNRLNGQPEKVTGLTDSDGRFTGEGGFGPAGFGGSITKEGYYQSGAPIAKFSKIDSLTNRWLPWNETYTTVLRAVGRPVPLYARELRKLDIPALDQPCGYDLEKSDWVAPWGRGEHADFVFRAKRDYKDDFDFTAEVELSFRQPADGILRTTMPDVGRYSFFRWERFAPASGYEPTHHIQISNSDPRTGGSLERTFVGRDDRTRGYFFRVRTVEQNGRIVSANYGKVAGDIGVDARGTKTCYVYFTYYFNPISLERNLEWDTKRNLLTGLSREETPRLP